MESTDGRPSLLCPACYTRLITTPLYIYVCVCVCIYMLKSYADFYKAAAANGGRFPLARRTGKQSFIFSR